MAKRTRRVLRLLKLNYNIYIYDNVIHIRVICLKAQYKFYIIKT